MTTQSAALTAVCLLFLVKLRWPKKKNSDDKINEYLWINSKNTFGWSYYYLRQGRYVFGRVCLFVCLLVCGFVSNIISDPVKDSILNQKKANNKHDFMEHDRINICEVFY